MQNKKSIATDLIGAHIGQRLAARRSALGIAHDQLAADAGISAERLAEYESGEARIPAARLFVFSTVLGVPISYFFDEMPDDLASTLMQSGVDTRRWRELELDPHETLALVRAFASIDHSRLRGKITGLIQTIAEANGEPPSNQE
jgi:transcriptional regulator with XRE-family HTH domain